MASRYWRVVGLDSVGSGAVSLAEVEFRYLGSRVDLTAVITASHAPQSGALATLNDSSLMFGVAFSIVDVRSPRFFIQWDMGSSVNVDSIGFGSVSEGAMPSRFTVMSSVDGVVWDTVTHIYRAFPYLGDGVVHINPTNDPYYLQVVSLFDFGKHGTVDLTLDYWSKSSLSYGSAGSTYIATQGSLYPRGYQIPATATPPSVTLPSLPGDFTVEMGMFTHNRAQNDLLTLSGGYKFRICIGGNSYNHAVVDGSGATVASVTYNNSLLAGNGYFQLAWSRQGVTNRVFIQGVLIMSFSDSTIHPEGPMSLTNYSGICTHIRVTEGVCRYSESHVAPLSFPSKMYTESAMGEKPRDFISDLLTNGVEFADKSTQKIYSRYFGDGSIVGNVRKLLPPTTKLPLSRKVMLLDGDCLLRIDSTVSDALTGAFSFYGIRKGQSYALVVEDSDNIYRASVVNGVVGNG